MEKDKKKIIVGAGILGGAGLAYLLTRRKPPVEPVCTPGATKCEGSDLYLCNAQGQWGLSAKDSPECALPQEPLCNQGSVGSYELWLEFIHAPDPLDQLHPGQGVQIHYMLHQAPYDQEIFLTSNIPVVTWTITRPDGVIVTIERACPQINGSGTYNDSYTATLIGTYNADIGGCKFNFTVVPITSNIFYPDNIELIYDSAPYCLETYEHYKHIADLEGHQEGYNLLAIANKLVDLDLTTVNLQISKFFGPGEDDGRYYIIINGDVKNDYLGQACIPLTLKLIPPDLYAQSYLETGNYTYSLYHPKYWSYPDPEYRTLYCPHSGISRYYNTGDPSSTTGLKIATGATGLFQRTASGLWARGGSYRYKSATDQTWVQQLLVAGDRYEVVLLSGVGLPSYMSGYSYAAYPLKYWHIGYIIID